MTTATTATGTRTTEKAGRLRASSGRRRRRRGLMMKELAALMGVSEGYLSQDGERDALRGLRRCARRSWRCWGRSPGRGPSTARAGW